MPQLRRRVLATPSRATRPGARCGSVPAAEEYGEAHATPLSMPGVRTTAKLEGSFHQRTKIEVQVCGRSAGDQVVVDHHMRAAGHENAAGIDDIGQDYGVADDFPPLHQVWPWRQNQQGVAQSTLYDALVLHRLGKELHRRRRADLGG